MSVDSIEASEQDSEPREIYDIVHGVTSHRITFADHDLVHGGILYVATPGGRGSIEVSKVTEESALELTLPINHALVRRYLRNATPPQKITVTVRRKYYPSEDIETIWTGEIHSMRVDDENTEATFFVPDRGAESVKRLLPTITTSRLCPHVLYSTDCGVSRTGSSPGGVAHKVTATVIHVNGRDVRVDLGDTDRNGTWAERGEVVVMSGESAGERETVRTQTDLNPGVSAVAVLSIAQPIPGLQAGHTVEVYRGCNWTKEQCRDEFANQANHGGTPEMPSKNPFRLNAFGVYQDD